MDVSAEGSIPREISEIECSTFTAQVACRRAMNKMASAEVVLRRRKWTFREKMDLPGTAYLYTLATQTVTFVGFSVLIIIPRQAFGGGLSPLEINPDHAHIYPTRFYRGGGIDIAPTTGAVRLAGFGDLAVMQPGNVGSSIYFRGDLSVTAESRLRSVDAYRDLGRCDRADTYLDHALL